MNKKILLIIACIMNVILAVHAQEYDPVANPKAIVTSGSARFTVLTPRLIRMEWSAKKQFVDNASLTFVNRKVEVPEFAQKQENGKLVITTEFLELTYEEGSGKFTTENLKVTYKNGDASILWQPGKKNEGNLLGTTRTLDQANGAPREGLEQGIISRDGWMMIDDSERPLFDNSDWQWVMARKNDKVQDFYLFMYGDDYKAALKDYTAVAGKIAMPPRFAFGAWWSRYREYTDVQFRELVDEFDTHDVPLDVLVIDIDWHIRVLPEFFKNGQLQPDQAGQPYGWTGYTWDTHYFPDPDKFLKWTDDQNLKTCLNLHPASGVQPYEKEYPQMAKAMGINPATKKYVPFDITDKKFAKSYMDILLHPMEKSGIDFWWLDWQQWGSTNIPGVNPTFYLNYVHYSDMERQNKVRPLIFHRWGGLGNHRYQIGFSGDTYNTWKSLAYQPYFTATAANVGFGYWSHDIGGHFGYPNSAEMYTRWIQWGIFSPIFRTHCTASSWLERRIWAYPLEYFEVMRKAYWLRYAMVPYIYTEAHHSYESGVSIVHPLYYEYPDKQEAYDFKDQYMFGRNMLVSPITKPLGKDSLYTMQKVWLPEGDWFEMSTGTMLAGDRSLEMPFTIDDTPVFIKAGSIVPMQPKTDRLDSAVVSRLILNFYPGDKGEYTLYEDEGNNNNYKKGAFALTPIKYQREETSTSVVIEPVKGTFSGMLSSRAYELRFPNTFLPKKVLVNGKAYSYNSSHKEGSWSYSGDNLETRVYLPSSSVSKSIKVEIEFPDADQNLLSGIKGQLKYIQKFDNFRGKHEWDRGRYDALTIATLATFGKRLEYFPENIGEAQIHEFNDNWNKAVLTLQEISKEDADYGPYYELLKLFGEVPDSPKIQPKGQSNIFEGKAMVDIETVSDNIIYFSVDGTTPTRKSTQYVAPIKIEQPTVVKAIACEGADGPCSSVASATFYHENTGMEYAVYAGTFNQVPDFNQLNPDKKGVTHDLKLEDLTDTHRNYAAQFTGTITLPEKGKYTFYLLSDDGSKLFIDGNLIIDNDGPHSPTEKQATLKLSKGDHEVKIGYFQGAGGQQLSLELESGSLSRRNVLPLYMNTK